MSYTPRFGTEVHKALRCLVEHAPHGGEQWMLTKTLAELINAKSQAAVHSSLAVALQRGGLVLQKMVDERLRWQAGPDAADAVKRSAEVQPLEPMGFPNAKDRQPVEFMPREGGSMDLAIKFLKARHDLESITEPALCVELGLPPDSDLKTQFKAAVEAGALAWQLRTDGAVLVRHWSLGDGFAPHKETIAAPRGYRRRSSASAPEVGPLTEPRDEISDEAAPSAPASVEPIPVPRGAAMAFRCGFFTDGIVTIQKGHGAVELDAEEALLLFEHLSPWAQAQGRLGTKFGRAS